MASISEILIAKGRQEADSRRARAGAWMPLIQTLSNLPGQFVADRAAEREAQESAYDRAQQRDVRSQQLVKGEQEIAAGARTATEAEATAAQKQQMNELLATPGVIGDDNRFDIPTAQRLATEKGYRDILDDVLTFGQEWNEGVDKGLLTQEQIESAKRANQPQGYTLGPGDTRFAPGGAVEASVPAAEEEVSMVIKGPNGRPRRVMVPKSQLRSGGVEEYREPRAVEQTPTPTARLNATRALRNDFIRETSSANEVTLQYELMKSALEAAKKGDMAAGSQGVLVTFQKILDPTSVVRESEYARSASGLSLMSRMEGAMQTLAKGGAGVPIRDLEAFVRLAEQFARNQAAHAATTKEQIEGMASQFGLDPSFMTRDIGPDAPDQPSAPDPLGIR